MTPIKEGSPKTFCFNSRKNKIMPSVLKNSQFLRR